MTKRCSGPIAVNPTLRLLTATKSVPRKKHRFTSVLVRKVDTAMTDHVGREDAREAVLAQLRAAHRLADAVTTNRAEMVREARRFGASWQDIGDAIGMTRQSAHKRFGAADDHE